MTSSSTWAATLCVLLSSTCLAQSAFAQVVDVPPPTRYQVDENDVDVARGLYTGSRRDMVIGQGLGSLFFDVKYGQAPGTSLPGLVSSVGGGRFGRPSQDLRPIHFRCQDRPSHRLMAAARHWSRADRLTP